MEIYFNINIIQWGVRGAIERRRPPALRAGGRGLFDFCVFVVYWYFILFVSWRQGCFRDPRRSSMRIYFWTLAHERSGLSYHSSDMFYISSWRSWRLQARCTIPLFFSFFIFKAKIQLTRLAFNFFHIKKIYNPPGKNECDLLGGWLKVFYVLKYASKGARTYGRLRKHRWELWV